MILHEGLDLRLIPNEPGFFAREDGTLWTIWENRVAGRDPCDWSQGQALTKVEEHLLGNYRAAHLRYGHMRVHIAVLLAFKGPRPEGMEGCHEDGDKMNCKSSNLRWETRQSNAIDRIRHGTALGRYPKRLTIQQEVELHAYYKTGNYTMRSLADHYGLSLGGTRLIIERQERVLLDLHLRNYEEASSS